MTRGTKLDNCAAQSVASRKKSRQTSCAEDRPTEDLAEDFMRRRQATQKTERGAARSAQEPQYSTERGAARLLLLLLFIIILILMIIVIIIQSTNYHYYYYYHYYDDDDYYYYSYRTRRSAREPQQGRSSTTAMHRALRASAKKIYIYIYMYTHTVIVIIIIIKPSPLLPAEADGPLVAAQGPRYRYRPPTSIKSIYLSLYLSIYLSIYLVTPSTCDALMASLSTPDASRVRYRGHCGCSRLMKRSND